ncbi:hypothetical protein Alches_22270 [Alicyclobacillus hesperidum subsp. aegles]|uniref:methyl-accepting chemotaxis protein n=1 Tax=Alicyclobacillus hesperidum TaxID=89784 RepID=UPI00222A33F7|nr:methyl-accepting chemotaxis protein [Alicyclobacillus hesperidum]GLG02186.1 hypothetical protein Alches_22270 [Alicyclobacillus hesperidum subsp. aegles]
MSLWSNVGAQLTRFIPRLRIRQKFMVNTALLTVLIVAIGVANWVIVQKIHKAIQKVESAEQVLNMIRQFDYDIRSVDNDGAIYLLAPNGPEAQFAMQTYDTDAQQVQQDLRALQKMHVSSQDEAILNLFESQWQPILSQNKMAFQVAGTDLASAQTQYTTNTIQPLIQSMMQFTNDEQAVKNAANSQVDALLKQTVLWNVLIAVIAILIGFGGSWTLSVVITKPILRMRKLAFELSKGNLKVEELKLASRDELADLANVLNTLAANLRTLILGIAEASEHVAASSEELSASSDEMMHATEEIAQSIEQVAAGAVKQMDEINQTSGSVQTVIHEIDKVSELAGELHTTAEATQEQAGTGAGMMESMAHQMDTIRLRADRAAELIARLAEKSADIRHIVETIANIADQTNLLALNAAIEAARAGEHGRGFGVVAEEVRNLAQGSAAAAREIDHIINSLMEATEETVRSINDVTSEVQEGTVLAGHTKETFARIRQSMDAVGERVDVVTEATRTIADRAVDMAKYMEVVVHLAQTAAANSQSVVAASQTQSGSMEEIAATAGSLSERAQELQGLIGRFQM